MRMWINLALRVGAVLGTLTSCSKPSENVPMSGPLDAKLNLLVSNQSAAISEVDIQVSIDGRRVVDDSFAAGAGHDAKRYELPLTSGKHEIHASTRKGTAQYDGAIDLQKEHWGALFYWYQPGEPGRPDAQAKSFTFDLQDTPMTLR
jgi:hypothetical protein